MPNLILLQRTKFNGRDDFVVVTMDSESREITNISRSLTEVEARQHLRKLGKTDEEIETMLAVARSRPTE